MPRQDEIIRKTFDAYIVKAERVSDKEGVVEAIVNTFGIIDKAQPPDIVHPGAFTKTIQERMGKIRVLDNHRTDSVKAAIGRPLELREVLRSELPDELLAQNPEATGGLYTKTIFMLNDPDSLAVFNRLEAGVINEFSIGFQVKKSDWSKEDDPDNPGKQISVRNVREVALFEYSSVLWGASETATLNVRNDTPDEPDTAKDDKEVTADGELEVQRFGDVLWGMIVGRVMTFTSEMLIWGTISMEEMDAITLAINTTRDVLKSTLSDELWMRAIGYGYAIQLAENLKPVPKTATLNHETPVQQDEPELPPASEAEPPAEALTSTQDIEYLTNRLRLLKLRTLSMEENNGTSETRPPGGENQT